MFVLDFSLLSIAIAFCLKSVAKGHSSQRDFSVGVQAKKGGA